MGGRACRADAAWGGGSGSGAHTRSRSLWMGAALTTGKSVAATPRADVGGCLAATSLMAGGVAAAAVTTRSGGGSCACRVGGGAGFGGLRDWGGIGDVAAGQPPV